MAGFGSDSSTRKGLLRKVQQGLFRDAGELAHLLHQLEQMSIPTAELPWMLTHRSAEVRDFAARHVLAGELQADTIRELLGAMGRPSDASRRQVAQLLIQADPAAVARHIGPMAVSRRGEDRELAVFLLGIHPQGPSQLRIIRGLLADPVPEIRAAAVGVLALNPNNPGAFLTLLDLLHDADREIRRRALSALAKSGNPEIVEPFLDRLPEEAEAEQAIIITALAAFARDPAARIEERVLPALADERDAVRGAAVQLLGLLPDRVRAVRSFLAEAPQLAYWLRERCVQSLLKVSAQLVEPLLALMEDDSQDVRVGALTLASHISDQRFLPAMRSVFLSEEDWWIRSLAADVLAATASPQVVDCLASRLHEPDMRYAIVSALGKTRDERALPHLFEALATAERGVRSCALDALQGFAEHAEAVQRVADAVEGDEDGALRDKARAVLGEMGEAGQRAAALVDRVARDQAEQASPPPAPDLGGLQMENEQLNAPAAIAPAGVGQPAPSREPVQPPPSPPVA